MTTARLIRSKTLPDLKKLQRFTATAPARPRRQTWQEQQALLSGW